MSSYPESPSAVNAGDPAQPGFYAIIPASVRYCVALPPAAKLLFGEIVALTTVKGYCYAQNPYFMALYSVDRATVKRWLAALSEQGFIKIEFDGSERRIFALAMMPKAAQKCATPGAKLRHHRRKNAPQSITLSITESNTLLARGVKFAGPGPVPAQELQEQKGPASPELLNVKKCRQVERAVAVCRDLASRSRFRELWDVVDGAGCAHVWRDGLDAVKTGRGASTGVLEAPTALFVRVVAAGLASHGMELPAGLAPPAAAAACGAAAVPQPHRSANVVEADAGGAR